MASETQASIYRLCTHGAILSELSLIRSQTTTTEVRILCIPVALYFILFLLMLSSGFYFPSYVTLTCFTCFYVLFMSFSCDALAHVISFVVKHFELHFLYERCRTNKVIIIIMTIIIIIIITNCRFCFCLHTAYYMLHRNLKVQSIYLTLKLR